MIDPTISFLTAPDGSEFQVLKPQAYETRTVTRTVTLGVIPRSLTETITRYEQADAVDPDGQPILVPVTEEVTRTVYEPVTQEVTEDEQVALPREWDEEATYAAYRAAFPE